MTRSKSRLEGEIRDCLAVTDVRTERSPRIRGSRPVRPAAPRLTSTRAGSGRRESQGDWIEREITRTSLALGGGPGRRVALTDLRRAIPEVGRIELDDALRSMSSRGEIALFPLDDRWSIRPEDQRDSVDLSGVPQHVLYVP